MKFAIFCSFLALCVTTLAQNKSDDLTCPDEFIYAMKAAQTICFPDMWTAWDERKNTTEKDTPIRQKRYTFGEYYRLNVVTERPAWKDNPEVIKELEDGVPCMEKNLKDSPYYDKISAICDQEAATLANDKRHPAQVRFDCMVGYIDQCFGPFWFASVPWLNV